MLQDRDLRLSRARDRVRVATRSLPAYVRAEPYTCFRCKNLVRGNGVRYGVLPRCAACMVYVPYGTVRTSVWCHFACRQYTYGTLRVATQSTLPGISSAERLLGSLLSTCYNIQYVHKYVQYSCVACVFIGKLYTCSVTCSYIELIEHYVRNYLTAWCFCVRVLFAFHILDVQAHPPCAYPTSKFRRMPPATTEQRSYTVKWPSYPAVSLSPPLSCCYRRVEHTPLQLQHIMQADLCRQRHFKGQPFSPRILPWPRRTLLQKRYP